jgi:hypothetical protein
MPVTYTEVERLFASARDRYLLLLLTEPSSAVQKVKPGIPALSYSILDVLTAEEGALDETLTNWAGQRPSRLIYRRLDLDRHDTKTMVRLGVTWLPQVRLMRRGTVLFRSSVSVGDNGEFLAQDVGGKSFRRRVEPSPEGFSNLLDALSAEVDRPRRP